MIEMPTKTLEEKLQDLFEFIYWPSIIEVAGVGVSMAVIMILEGVFDFYLAVPFRVVIFSFGFAGVFLLITSLLILLMANFADWRNWRKLRGSEI